MDRLALAKPRTPEHRVLEGTFCTLEMVDFSVNLLQNNLTLLDQQ